MRKTEFFAFLVFILLLCFIAAVCRDISDKVNRMSYLMETAIITQQPNE